MRETWLAAVARAAAVVSSTEEQESFLMQEGVELILNPAASVRDCRTVANAIVAWCELTKRVPMSQQLHLVIKGGPCLTLEATEAFWLGMVPPDAVESMSIDGKLWTAGGPVARDPSAAGVESCAAAAVN
jgi:hypothetical protein